MSIRTERQKAIEDHRKFLADSTQAEQKRYEEARAQADASSGELAGIIVRIGEAKAELSRLNKQKIEANTDILNALSEITALQDKQLLAEESLAETNQKIQDKIDDFNVMVAQKDTDFAVREAGLKELSDDLDDKARQISLDHDRAKKEQVEAGKIKAETEVKIAELRELASSHALNVSKYDQDRAKLNDEAEQVDRDREDIKSTKLGLLTKENNLLNMEAELNQREEALRDRAVSLEVREATLIKREKRLQDQIELHQLKG